MAARSIGSGTISFGLVSVPVKLYSATRSKSISFNLLHEKDHSRLKQQYICQGCGETVERAAMVKGYEYAKDQYAILGEDDLKALDEKSDQSIEIQEFVPIADVDPVYFEKSYFLGPDKGGTKAYRLLCAAMAKAGRGAVAQYSTRGKQELVLLREVGDALMLHQLHWADEVASVDEIDRGETVEPKEGELGLAVQLIEQLASEHFRPAKYEDQYRKKVLEVIDRKVAGQEVVVAPTHAPRAQIIDLMEALKASLNAKREQPSSEMVERKPARSVGRKASEPARKRGGRSA